MPDRGGNLPVVVEEQREDGPSTIATTWILGLEVTTYPLLFPASAKQNFENLCTK